jgi:hypothetical protein
VGAVVSGLLLTLLLVGADGGAPADAGLAKVDDRAVARDLELLRELELLQDMEMFTPPKLDPDDEE